MIVSGASVPLPIWCVWAAGAACLHIRFHSWMEGSGVRHPWLAALIGAPLISAGVAYRNEWGVEGAVVIYGFIMPTYVMAFIGYGAEMKRRIAEHGRKNAKEEPEVVARFIAFFFMMGGIGWYFAETL